MSAKDELRKIIIGHCDLQVRDVALRLLDCLRVDEGPHSNGSICFSDGNEQASSSNSKCVILNDEEAFVDLLIPSDDQHSFVGGIQMGHAHSDGSSGANMNTAQAGLVGSPLFHAGSGVAFPALGNGNMRFITADHPVHAGNGSVHLGWPGAPPGVGATWGGAGAAVFSDPLSGVAPGWGGSGFAGGSWDVTSGRMGGGRATPSNLSNHAEDSVIHIANDDSSGWNSFNIDSNTTAQESRLLGPALLLAPVGSNQDMDESQAIAKFSTIVGARPKTSSRGPQPSDVVRREEQIRIESSKQALRRGSAQKTDGKRYDVKRMDASGVGCKQGQVVVPKIKLRGLPFGATISDVTSFFRGYGAIEGTVTFGFNSDGRPSGEAWVSFSRLEDARRAVREKDRHHMRDRYVELFLLNEGGAVVNKSAGHPK